MGRSRHRGGSMPVAVGAGVLISCAIRMYNFSALFAPSINLFTGKRFTPEISTSRVAVVGAAFLH